MQCSSRAAYPPQLLSFGLSSRLHWGACLLLTRLTRPCWCFSWPCRQVPDPDPALLAELREMGFPQQLCRNALLMG